MGELESLRTSHATWLKMAGADVKDAQAQMRHSRSSTTLDIYQQFVPKSQQRGPGAKLASD
jgi:integrase